MDSVAGDTSYQRKKVGASCLNTKSVGTSWPRPLASRGVFLVARPTKNGRADSLLGAPCAVSMDPEGLPADRLWHPDLPADTAQAKEKPRLCYLRPKPSSMGAALILLRRRLLQPRAEGQHPGGRGRGGAPRAGGVPTRE